MRQAGLRLCPDPPALRLQESSPHRPFSSSWVTHGQVRKTTNGLPRSSFHQLPNPGLQCAPNGKLSLLGDPRCAPLLLCSPSATGGFFLVFRAQLAPVPLPLFYIRVRTRVPRRSQRRRTMISNRPLNMGQMQCRVICTACSFICRLASPVYRCAARKTWKRIKGTQ